MENSGLSETTVLNMTTESKIKSVGTILSR